MGLCGRACAATEGCEFWSYGMQPKDVGWMCYLRKSGIGRQNMIEFYSGTSACAPRPVPPATTALIIMKLRPLRDCMEGGSPRCPRPRRAVKTWRFGIEQMRLVLDGTVDAAMQASIDQIATDTEVFAIRLDETFADVVANNYIVFEAFQSFLMEMSTREGGVDLSDDSLPLPMRGLLCGDHSCYQN
eukprot:NODE_19312_length_849_cov_4.149584.p1 GENE.NODE_19312_length_849_cov_4.149584~~NODE_19312_length_849_cov_4.149584.p1  ORF type:complete len:187 (+),score=38.85 NODE_19312_length_849_cov_4.149584:94-654(+)